MNTVIQVDQLSKKYNQHTVLDSITFSVQSGEIFALLGANGAGKTTTLECIEGIRRYDSGAVKINGTIGVQLQSSSLPANITVIEVFRLFCKWNKAPENMELLETFGLKDLKTKQYRTMSTGQKRRLHLALALINNAEIIFLDEPTAGLDVEARVSLHKEIRKLKSQGKTIIMASHDMAEVESLCDRIAILKDGKIAFIGSATELTHQFKSDSKIYIKTKAPLDHSGLVHSVYEAIQQEYLIVVASRVSDALLELLKRSQDTQNDVVDIKIERVTLEQRFIEIATEVKS